MKNILQSVVGLMRAQLTDRPDLALVLEPAISKVLAVSVGFGLMGSKYRPGVVLCEMVREIGSNLEHITGAAIECSFEESIAREPVVVDGAQAVNIALVLNELLFNAVKHGKPLHGRASVKVRLSRDAERGIVRIFNEGRLPPDFDFRSGRGIGTGLNLARLLLQPDAVRVTFEQTAEGVTVTLRVRSAAAGAAERPRTDS